MHYAPTLTPIPQVTGRVFSPDFQWNHLKGRKCQRLLSRWNRQSFGLLGVVRFQCTDRMLGQPPRKDTTAISAVGRTDGVTCTSSTGIRRAGVWRMPSLDYSVGRSWQTSVGNTSTRHRLPRRRDSSCSNEVELPQQSKGSDQSGASGIRSGVRVVGRPKEICKP